LRGGYTIKLDCGYIGKFDPLIATPTPAGPLVGKNFVMAGGAVSFTSIKAEPKQD
jgi:hypothetical protein